MSDDVDWNIAFRVYVVRARMVSRVRTIGPANKPRGVWITLSKSAVKRLRLRAYNRKVPGVRKMSATMLMIRHLGRTMKEADGKEAA